MNISEINSLIRAVDKLKDAHEYIHTEEDREVNCMTNILNYIQLIEREITLLKLNKNSLAGKMLIWFTQFKEQNPEKAEAFSLKATESTFSISVQCEKAFNLNLKEIDGYYDREFPDNYKWKQFESYENQEDAKKLDKLLRKEIFKDNWLSDNHFDKLITSQSSNQDWTSINLNFKMSKKLFKDEEEFNKIMISLLDLIWAHCEKARI